MSEYLSMNGNGRCPGLLFDWDKKGENEWEV
jgi:hypothetical protein